MPLMNTKWKFYVPEDGATADDANPIRIYGFERIYTADDAAGHAAHREWEDGGHERQIDSTVTIVVIAPDGAETRWTVSHEATVEHYVRQVNAAGVPVYAGAAE